MRNQGPRREHPRRGPFSWLRRAFAELSGRRTRYPPPRTDDPEGLRAALAEFLAGSPDRYRSLFLEGRPLRPARGERGAFRAFGGAGLTEPLLGSFTAPRVRLFPVSGGYVATDLATHRDPDQVFSLMFEQAYALRNTSVGEGDRVLDLCAGSGVLSLRAARQAERVVAVDVSDRALAFARFNTDLSAPEAPIELLRGDLFAPLDPHSRFDLIITNPPFEPVPLGATHFLHSHGGEDGLDLVRAILAEAPRRLAPDGRFEVVTMSPGDERETMLTELVRDAFPEARIELHVLGVEPVESWLERFRAEHTYPEWRDRLLGAGITVIRLVFARAALGEPAGLEVLHPADEIEASLEVVDGWYGG